MAFHCKKSLAVILGGKLSEEVFCRPSTAPVVLPSVGLSICLLAIMTILQDVSVDKEELVKFWKSSASGSGSRDFLGFFNIAGSFCNKLCAKSNSERIIKIG